MDSYAIRRNSERNFTVTVKSPANLKWKPLESDGISIIDNQTKLNSDGKDYSWTLEVEKPGYYEFNMIHQGVDGVFKRFVIPIKA